MAADVLAMAPQTNIGSSTPISVGGEDISKDLRRKVVNDAAAYIGELAREHGRNVAVAREMVTKATNLGAREALRAGRRSTSSRPTTRISSGRSTATRSSRRGSRSRLGAGVPVKRIEMSAWKSILDLLIDPNIIALMLSVGLIGIVVELWNPGLIFPGTVGAISLIVGLYGLQVLPVSAAGLLLMMLAAGVLRRRGVHRLARSAFGRGRRHVRDRRAAPVRSRRRRATRCRCRSRSRSRAR